MTGEPLNKIVKPFLISTIFFLAITFSSLAQIKQSFRNHEEIEVGEGMKVEILTCSGEGPTEICDCIYFKDKRQNGTRMKQNANQLKEEERAGLLAKGIKNPEVKRSGSVEAAENRADKTISMPLSIIQSPKPQDPRAALEEAVKKADSVARIGSQKMTAALLKVPSVDDSTEMDQVFIPKITETGATRFETSAVKAIDPGGRPDTTAVVNATAKSAAARIVSATVDPTVSADSLSTPTEANKNSDLVKPPNHKASVTSATNPNQKQAISNDIAEVKNAATTAPAIVSDTAAQPVIAVRENSIVSAPSANSATIPPSDTTENWVKQYQHVKAASDTVAGLASDTSQSQIEIVDSATLSSVKTSVENPLQTIDTRPNNATSGVVETSKEAENKVSWPIVKNSWPATGNATVDNSNNKTGAEKSEVPKATVTKTSIQDSLATPAVPAAAPVSRHNDPAVSISDAIGATKLLKEEAVPLPWSAAAVSTGNVIGRSAEANTKGEWEKVTIVDKETEFLYKVHYLGSSSDHDEWVSVTQLRNIDSSPSTNPANNSSEKAPLNKSTQVNGNCSFAAPAPPVANAANFSEKLAKRKIYEQCLAENKGNKSIRTGVTFLSFQAEAPYVNTVSISSTNNLEIKVSFAPAGAMIYPVKTQYKMCEQVSGKTTSKTIDSNYACYRNKEGGWTCTNMQ